MKIRRTVRFDAETVMQALEAVKASFSGGEEGIDFQIPIRLRSGLEATMP